eukprot:6190024-Pleurochrysis_carterae.AAC.3
MLLAAWSYRQRDILDSHSIKCSCISLARDFFAPCVSAMCSQLPFAPRASSDQLPSPVRPPTLAHQPAIHLFSLKNLLSDWPSFGP